MIPRLVVRLCNGIVRALVVHVNGKNGRRKVTDQVISNGNAPFFSFCCIYYRF